MEMAPGMGGRLGHAGCRGTGSGRALVTGDIWAVQSAEGQAVWTALVTSDKEEGWDFSLG